MNKFLKIAKNIMPYGIVRLFQRSKYSRAKKEIQRWFADKGDETLRLNYPELNDASIVFDMGGYKGDFASNIFSKYCCEVYVFEPVKKYAENIQDRFSKNPKIKVYSFALGAKKILFLFQ